MTTAPGSPATPAWPRRLPAIAETGYLAAWIAGLAVWPSNLALNATSAQVTAAYRSQAGPAMTQYLLVEGVAGVLLAVVLTCAVLPAQHGRLAARALPAAVLSAVAVAVSLAQCVLGLMLTAAAEHGDVSRAGTLSVLVTRLDGAKMVALAGVAGYLALRRLDYGMPRWLRVTAILTAVTLIASGCAYLLLANSLAWTVYLSGPLLVIWVTGTGFCLSATGAAGRRWRRRPITTTFPA